MIEGIDRSGKSTLAKYYEKQGYEIVHMGPPDKKYFKEGYAGESYFEELVRMYSYFEGRNVVFDRTVYGELIWPSVFGREAMLSEEDLQYLASIENNNEADRILMYDDDTDAHWQRCADNDEPITRQQFGRANVFYERLVKDYGFKKQTLKDVGLVKPGHKGDTGSTGDTSATKDGEDSNKPQQAHSHTDVSGSNSEDIDTKLERANAIRSLLSGKIIKKKGEIYDDIESSVRGFLTEQLDNIFSPRPQDQESFTEDEIAVLKRTARRILDKME